MKRLLLCLCLVAGPAAAQDLLIRHATVHTAGARGTLADADVLVQGGVVRAVGANLPAPAGVTVVEARGKHLTPGLFGGFSDMGLEEVSAEKSTVDSAVEIPGTGVPQTRPEFDVTLAYNPASILLPVARLGGLTFTALSASGGGSLIAGQGGVMRLDGDPSAATIGSKILFINLGAGAEVDEQDLRSDRRRGRVAVQAHDAALAGDQAAAAAGAERGEGQSAQACDRQQDRGRVVGEGDVELRPRLRHAGAGDLDGAVDGALFGGDFLQAHVGKTAEQAWREVLAAGLDDGDAGGRGQVGADRAHHAALHQHIGVGERAAGAGGVHGGVADQQVLGGGGAGDQAQAQQQALHGDTPWPSRKSERGCRDGSARS